MPDRKHMVDEVEFHVEHPIPVWNCAGGQSAGTHVRRYLPPVIQQRYVNHPNLADDLAPHVQGVAGGRPFVDQQRWPVVGPSGAVHVVPSRSWPSVRMMESVEGLSIVCAVHCPLIGSIHSTFRSAWRTQACRKTPPLVDVDAHNVAGRSPVG